MRSTTCRITQPRFSLRAIQIFWRLSPICDAAENAYSFFLRGTMFPANYEPAGMDTSMSLKFRKISGAGILSIGQNRNPPPRGGWPLDVIPFQLWQLKDIY